MRFRALNFDYHAEALILYHDHVASLESVVNRSVTSGDNDATAEAGRPEILPPLPALAASSVIRAVKRSDGATFPMMSVQCEEEVRQCGRALLQHFFGILRMLSRLKLICTQPRNEKLREVVPPVFPRETIAWARLQPFVTLDVTRQATTPCPSRGPLPDSGIVEIESTTLLLAPCEDAVEEDDDDELPSDISDIVHALGGDESLEDNSVDTTANSLATTGEKESLLWSSDADFFPEMADEPSVSNDHLSGCSSAHSATSVKWNVNMQIDLAMGDIESQHLQEKPNWSDCGYETNFSEAKDSPQESIPFELEFNASDNESCSSSRSRHSDTAEHSLTKYADEPTQIASTKHMIKSKHRRDASNKGPDAHMRRRGVRYELKPSFFGDMSPVQRAHSDFEEGVASNSDGSTVSGNLSSTKNALFEDLNDTSEHKPTHLDIEESEALPEAPRSATSDNWLQPEDEHNDQSLVSCDFVDTGASPNSAGNQTDFGAASDGSVGSVKSGVADTKHSFLESWDDMAAAIRSPSTCPHMESAPGAGALLQRSSHSSEEGLLTRVSYEHTATEDRPSLRSTPADVFTGPPKVVTDMKSTRSTGERSHVQSASETSTDTKVSRQIIDPLFEYQDRSSVEPSPTASDAKGKSDQKLTKKERKRKRREDRKIKKERKKAKRLEAKRKRDDKTNDEKPVASPEDGCLEENSPHGISRRSKAHAHCGSYTKQESKSVAKTGTDLKPPDNDEQFIASVAPAQPHLLETTPAILYLDRPMRARNSSSLHDGDADAEKKSTQPESSLRSALNQSEISGNQKMASVRLPQGTRFSTNATQQHMQCVFPTVRSRDVLVHRAIQTRGKKLDFCGRVHPAKASSPASFSPASRPCVPARSSRYKRPKLSHIEAITTCSSTKTHQTKALEPRIPDYRKAESQPNAENRRGQNPHQLLCSSSFCTKWPDVMSELLYCHQTEKGLGNVEVFECSMIASCCVDVEIPSRGGILVFSATALEQQGALKEIIVDLANLAAVGRYRFLHVFISYDVEITQALSRNMSQMQNAVLHQKRQPQTKISFVTCTDASIAQSMLEAVLCVPQSQFSTSSQFVALAINDGHITAWVSYLIANVPCLSVNGAIQCLEAAQSLTHQSIGIAVASLMKNQRVRQQIMMATTARPSKRPEISPMAMVQLNQMFPTPHHSVV